MSKNFDEQEHPRNARGEWIEKPNTDQPEATLGGADDLDGDDPQEVFDYALHKTCAMMSRFPRGRFVDREDIAQEAVTQFYKYKQNPDNYHTSYRGYISKVVSGLVSQTVRGEDRHEDVKARKMWEADIAARSAELNRSLSWSEKVKLANKIRDSWHDKDHKPKKDFFNNKTTVVSATSADGDDFTNSVLDSGRAVVSARPTTPQPEPKPSVWLEAMNSNRLNPANKQLTFWPTLATQAGIDFPAAGSGDPDALRTARREMLSPGTRDQFPAKAALAIEDWNDQSYEGVLGDFEQLNALVNPSYTRADGDGWRKQGISKQQISAFNTARDKALANPNSGLSSTQRARLRGLDVSKVADAGAKSARVEHFFAPYGSDPDVRDAVAGMFSRASNDCRAGLWESSLRFADPRNKSKVDAILSQFGIAA